MIHKKKKLIISGVTKAGTTSLFTYLNKHRKITGSAIKETCFFLPLRYDQPHKNIEEYFKFFNLSEDSEYLMEATPGYFYGGRKIAETIHQKLPEVKIILLLRNPVERFISFYKYIKGLGKIPEDLPMDQYLNKSLLIAENRTHQKEEEYPYFGYQDGLYHEYLREWLSEFERDEILILYFENFVKDTIDQMQAIASFLDIEGETFCDQSLYTVENKSVAVKNRKLHTFALTVNNIFEKFFREHSFIKNKIRDIYFYLNEKEFDENIDENFKRELFSLYEKSIIESEKILEEYNYVKPDWHMKFD